MNFEEELHNLIAARAHELSQQSNNSSGDEFSNWLRAEEEISQELKLRTVKLYNEINQSI